MILSAKSLVTRRVNDNWGQALIKFDLESGVRLLKECVMSHT